MKENMKLIISVFIILLSLFVSTVAAQPTVSNVIVTDVTTSSFSVAWTADKPSTPQIEVFSDPDGLNPVSASIINVSQNHPPAEDQGVLQVAVSGLDANTAYYFRLTTTAKDGSGNTIYPDVSPLPSVKTENRITRSIISGTDELPFTNNQLTVDIYMEDGITPADGALVLLDIPGADYPVSSFVGSGSVSPTTIIDLNNLFDRGSYESLDLKGNEEVILRLMGGMQGNTYASVIFPEDMEVCEIITASVSAMPLVMDTDYDTIPDGIGINPCTGGDFSDCDDNCIDTPNPDQADIDSDGFGDVCDNCQAIANPEQTDTDGDNFGDVCDNCKCVANALQIDTNSDGYGNRCDADLNNDGIVNAPDFGMFAYSWGKCEGDVNYNPDANLTADNGDVCVSAPDFGVFAYYYSKAVGYCP